MLFGAEVWDPTLIIAQIVSLQCLFYLSLGIWHQALLGPWLGRLTVLNVFGWRHLGFKSGIHWLALLCNLSTAPTCALFLVWIVERAKKCLDYATTIYFLHLIACSCFEGFPLSLAWWTVNGVGLVIAALLGEWLCVRREMQDIPLGSLRARSAGVPSGTGTSTAAQAASRATAGTGGGGGGGGGSGVQMGMVGSANNV